MRKLAIVDKERKDCKIEYLRKQEENKYTFKPNINPISRMIVQSKVNQLDTDLADVTKREQRLMKKKVLAQEEKMKECSFKPKINKKKQFDNVQSHYNCNNYDKKIEEYQERKELIVSASIIESI